MSEGCVFCDQSWMRAAEIFIETPHCVFVSTRDPGIRARAGLARARAGLAEDVLPGSGAIVPIVHRTSVFELTQVEWADTRDLLLRARTALHDLLAPDGYLLGWNQGGVLHPHMHVIPRFDDEPLAALGGQRPGKQAARSVGARERTGTSGCRVSEPPGPVGGCRAPAPVMAARAAWCGGLQWPAGAGLRLR